MKVYTDWNQVPRPRAPVVLAAGFFDGVHRGHRRVLGRTCAAASRAGGRAWVLTFDTHPLKVLHPGAAPRLLTAWPHKRLLLRRSGVEACLALPFSRALARLEPEVFIQRLHAHLPSLARVVVGRDWRFGQGGRGTPATLAGAGRRLGFAVDRVPSVLYRGDAVSSTRIRDAVQGGRLDDAAAMLDRPFSVLGTVVRGRGRGRRLDCPTANLDIHNETLPPEGAYTVLAVAAERGRRIRDGVLNLGVRPTFGGRAGPPVLELHLLDYRGTLYGRNLEVFFVSRLRGERTFPSAEALRAQLRRDVSDAHAVLRHAAGARKKVKESLYSFCRGGI
ncbi:MAG: riboflavin biosynthesis protein RibF [Lentisphaerae bacterium]|nr:riboflavin biosynthesis protein RibF [Lentisphaerota bacterium]